MMALSTNIFSLYLLCFLLLSLQIHARLSQFFDKSMLMTTSHFPAGYPSTHRGSFSYHNSPGRYLHGSFGLVSVPSGRVPASVYVPETTSTTTTTTTTSTTTANNNNNKDMGDYKSNNPQKTNSDDSHEKTPADDSSSLWDSLKSNYPYLFVFVMFSFIGYPVYNRNSNNNSNNINSNNSNSNNNWPDDRGRREVEFSEIRFPAENYSLVRDQHEIHTPRGQYGGYSNGSLLPVNNIYDNSVSLDGSSNFVFDT